jgi:hypothetical protein
MGRSKPALTAISRGVKDNLAAEATIIAEKEKQETKKDNRGSIPKGFSSRLVQKGSFPEIQLRLSHVNRHYSRVTDAKDF